MTHDLMIEVKRSYAEEPATFRVSGGDTRELRDGLREAIEAHFPGLIEQWIDEYTQAAYDDLAYELSRE